MPALHNPPNYIKANSTIAREYGTRSGGGRVAQRMLEHVSWHNEHAGQVLLSSPVLFWLFADYEYQHIAETIESLGSAKRVLREHFELPKAAMRIRGPWPRGSNRRIFQFLQAFEPATLANEIPQPEEVWRFMQTIDVFIQAAVLNNRPPNEFDAVNLFALRNWRTLRDVPDLRHACDWLWIEAPMPLPKKMSVDVMVRNLERWDLDREKLRRIAETGPIPALNGYIDGAVFPEGAFTLLRSPTDLKEEGYQMKHCVGSYVGPVRSGRSVIFHFQNGDCDDKPERTTLELRPTIIDDRKMKFDIAQNRGPHNGQISTRARTAADKMCRLFNTLYGERQANFFKL
jgi:hypothetical protein